jgi:hypothetical protein
MKLLGRVLVFAVMVGMSACQESSNGSGGVTQPGTELPGTIDGEFYIDPSVNGSVANTQVAVYNSEVDFRNRQPAMVVKTNENGRYFITAICGGHYYLDAWKDNNGDSAVNTGDYYLAHKDCYGCVCACIVEPGTAASFCGKLEVVP